MNWFSEKSVKQGIFWGILIYLVSAINDVLSKILGSRLHFIEISFFRFLFSIIVLIPIIFFKKELLKTKLHSLHLVRGVLGSIALALCCFSVSKIPLAENTIILFTESLFVLPLSWIFLKEKIKLRAIIATIIGFSGLLIMFNPKVTNINILAIIPTVAAFLFAVMDIMIKEMVDLRENQLTMLFYFGLYTTVCSGLFVPFVWQTPNLHEIYLIFLLGIGANLIQVFIFLAYRATEASNLSVVRYIELPFVILFGYTFFGQIPTMYSILGAVLIIISTFVISKI